jgi:hypothetical protein
MGWTQCIYWIGETTSHNTMQMDPVELPATWGVGLAVASAIPLMLLLLQPA